MRVAVDAMGGDHAPRAVVEGAVAAARESDIGVTLVGDADRIRAELDRQPDVSRLDIIVVGAADVVGMGESPAQAIRRKPNASIKVAADLVARGDAAALFSAGNTGATVLAAYTAFGLLRGAERPALAATVPTATGVALLLDVGANANCRPQHLVTFGVMGSAYARLAFGATEPAVGLLSIGEEATKGNELTREAHRLLRATSLRFIGNVEARDVYSGAADVVVCDGFTGNVALKVSEGIVEMVEALLRQAFSAADASQDGYQQVREAFEHLRRRVDYSEYGGAPLLGVAGACIVGHGRSSTQAVRNGIVLAHRFAEGGLTGRLEQELAALEGTVS
ncbi:MAG: phosphate acyltransferase PlsX [Acidobacteria bacterium]|nr:phosphate acyltransferase PlsX [Acidobacteriota bacterium]